MYDGCMPKRLMISPHLTVAALETRYRSTRDPVARSHWQPIWLLAQGRLSAQGAAGTGDTVRWVRTLAPRYNRQGPAGLGDRRHRNPGSVGLVSATRRAYDHTPHGQPVELPASMSIPPADPARSQWRPTSR
jgi:hypothetical protein